MQLVFVSQMMFFEFRLSGLLKINEELAMIKFLSPKSWGNCYTVCARRRE